MHIVGPDVNSDELASFTVRSDVQAIPCPEGATVTDKDGNQLASYSDKCYVVVDGDERFIVSGYVFDGLYTETSAPKATVTTSEDIAAQHAQAAPVATATQAATGVTFDDEAKAVLSDLTPEQRAELRAALADLDGPTPTDTTASSATGSATGSATAADATGGASTAGADVTAAAGNAGTAETATTATPSVAALSAPDGGDGSGSTAPASTGGQ
jgi:hypothetical protein